MRAQDRISFSLARVTATYSSRSSSAIISPSNCLATAFRARVVNSTIRSRSRPLGPTPSLGWKSMGFCISSRFNLLASPARMTTGNSSPLDLWMLIRRTPAPSRPVAAAVRVSPFSRSRAR